jgi:NitT/TauT family transport system permease protein
LVVLAAALVAWEELPKVAFLASRSHLLDSFFISSPSRILAKLFKLFTDSDNEARIWPYVWPTLGASLVGLLIGVATGVAAGLLLGSSNYLSAVFRPFAVAMNATPRIALIPIVVIIFGPTFQASVVVAVMVVFFVVFFNAYEGAQSPPEALLQNTTLMGANRLQIMLSTRLPYVAVWTLASLPVAATFSIISVVTGEILTGYPGLGRLVTIAQYGADSTLTFAVVVVLSVLGLVVVGVAELAKRRALHWWREGRS